MIKYEVVVSNGTTKWYLDGKLHREDGPAIEYATGSRVWCLNDKYHREEGPAIERANGTKEWWLNGKKLTEEEFNKRTQDTVAVEIKKDKNSARFSIGKHDMGFIKLVDGNIFVRLRLPRYNNEYSTRPLKGRSLAHVLSDFTGVKFRYDYTYADSSSRGAATECYIQPEELPSLMESLIDYFRSIASDWLDGYGNLLDERGRELDAKLKEIEDKEKLKDIFDAILDKVINK